MYDIDTAWDKYCEQQDQAYEMRIYGKTCKNCGECELSPDENTSWGWCRDQDEFVQIDMPVSEIRCEVFHE